MTINASTGVFTWTPTEAQGPGSLHASTVVVSDGSLSDRETITITVGEVERRPGARPRSATRRSTKADRADLHRHRHRSRPAGQHPDLQPRRGAPAGGMPSTPPPASFTWTPTEAQGPGSYTL